MEQLVDIAAVEVVGGYRLLLTFEDAMVGEVDFGGREWRGVFEPLREPAFFARVRVAREGGHDRVAQRREHGARAALRGGLPQHRRAGFESPGEELVRRRG